jgi:membrane protease YdiL (CAAX protease family)
MQPNNNVGRSATRMQTPQLENEGRSGLARKVAALLEVLGVFIAGNGTASHLGPLMGVMPLASLFQSPSNTAEPDFIVMSVGWLQCICFQYACLLPPAFALGWWRRRLSLRHYGVTRAGQPVLELVVLGLLVFSLVALPLKLLWVAKRFIPLGPEPAYWALLDKSWTPAFWLFLAVSSFVVTPVLEELFYRGYCQTRLEEDFGGIGAIAIVTLFMALGHNQYHHLSILSIGTIVALIPLTFGMGYVYWRSRSLLPAMIIHAAVNVPTKGIYDFVLPAAMVAVLILFRQKWLSMVRDLFRSMAGQGWKRAAFVATLLAIAVVIGSEWWPGVFIPLGFLGLAVALFMEFRGRRLERSLAQIES